MILLDLNMPKMDGREALEHIKADTHLPIDHRLQTIAQANMIHVFEKGTIVESGRHTELLARSGRYAHFHRMRFQAENPPLAPELMD
jgi:ABC-type transport system involved in Fe-S cluster assembly fused permease/ATPase subunit